MLWFLLSDQKVHILFITSNLEIAEDHHSYLNINWQIHKSNTKSILEFDTPYLPLLCFKVIDITTRETLPGLYVIIAIIGVSVTVTDTCIRGCVRVGFIINMKVKSTSEGWTIGSGAINLILFGLVFDRKLMVVSHWEDEGWWWRTSCVVVFNLIPNEPSKTADYLTKFSFAQCQSIAGIITFLMKLWC